MTAAKAWALDQNTVFGSTASSQAGCTIDANAVGTYVSDNALAGTLIITLTSNTTTISGCASSGVTATTTNLPKLALTYQIVDGKMTVSSNTVGGEIANASAPQIFTKQQ